MTDDFVVRKAFGRTDALRQEGLASGQKKGRTDAARREGRTSRRMLSHREGRASRRMLSHREGLRRVREEQRQADLVGKQA